MIDLSTLTISKARKAIIAGEYSSAELVDEYLKVIKEKNGEINAYLGLYESALENARAFDNLSTEEKSKLTLGGIPIAVKDNILVKGEVVSSASKILENYLAPYDATATRKLKDAGAILIGRTNMDEFAMGGSTENSAYGTTRNPHDTTRVPGGTSGGSAAAVAGGMALVALGSDTGGSIRQPSSFCGVVGLKPTYGAVSRYGLMAAVSSFDQIGPITRSVEDAEIIFNIIKGKDAFDSTSREETVVQSRGKVIGVPNTFVRGGGISSEVLKVFDDSIEKFKSLGYEVVDIELPNIKYALPAYYILNFAEISSNMSRYDGIRFGTNIDSEKLFEVYSKSRGAKLGKEVRKRIMLGTYVLSAGYYDSYYGKANLARGVIKSDYEKAFDKVDYILTPVAPTLPWKIGDKVTDPLSIYLEDIFTVTANLTGMPAISIPAGFANASGTKLPVGIQLMAPEFAEDALFEAGKVFENKL